MTPQDIINDFREDKVKELTPEEELVILRSLESSDFLDCGSSRAVYTWGDYVVKIGLSEEGQFQNNIERDYYNRLGNEYFAYLYAHGTFINVMECVEDVRYYEDYSGPEPDHDYTEHTIEEYEDDNSLLLQAINQVTGYYGGDNGQIGYSELRGRTVCYDYGYDDAYCRDDIVGNMDLWSENLDILQLAIDGIENDTTYTYNELTDMVLEEEGE